MTHRFTTPAVLPGNAVTLAMYSSRDTVYMDNIKLTKVIFSDVGNNPNLPDDWGSTTADNISMDADGVLTVTGKADNAEMAYTKMLGYFTAVAYLDSGEAAFTIREKLDGTGKTFGMGNVTGPVWLKIVRYGSLLQAYTSNAPADADPASIEWVQTGDVLLQRMDELLYVSFLAPANATAVFNSIDIADKGDELLVHGKFYPSAPEADAQLAFPGAYGYGAASAGGRGGRVVEVTNLNNSGPGSLRAALNETGPRTVVFKVSGDIVLSSQINLNESNSYLTIAGQTAPGEGVQIIGWPIGLHGGIHDVIITDMKFRPGHTGYNDWSKNCIDVYGSSANRPVYNIMIDHCTFSYGPDENIALWGNIYNVTVQNCITSYGIRHYYPSYQTSGQNEGSKGAIIGCWDNDGQYAATNISFIHNLFAHNDQRNPRVCSDRFEFVNNVIYNWGGIATHISAYCDNDDEDPSIVTGSRANIVGNYYKVGPNTSRDRGIIHFIDNTRDEYYWFEGNYLDAGNGTLDGQSTGYKTVEEMFTSGTFAGKEYLIKTDGAWSMSHFAPPSMTALEAYDYVLANVGPRVGGEPDSLDAGAINEVRTRTGSIYLTAPDEIPQCVFPVLAGGTPYIDTAGDGIDDEWKIANGIDPSEYVGDQVMANGYSILEHFLYGIKFESDKPVVTGAKASAYVEKLNGNKNRLFITVIETFSDGSTNAINWNGLIDNNAADIYTVEGYKIYVDTKGNTQIRACYIVT